MKKQNLLKKLLSSIIIAIIVLGQFSGYNFVSRAETITTEEGDSLYLSLSKTNEDGNGFAFGMNTQGGEGKHIWNFISSDSEGENSKYVSNLYCIKAEYGHTWEDQNQPNKSVKFDKTYQIPLETSTTSATADSVLLGEYKNEILWLIDNFYISNETDLEKYLKQAGISYYPEEGYAYEPSAEKDYTETLAVSTDCFSETVKEEDIIAIQQAAIWYFTNYGDTYNKLQTAPWLQYTSETLLEDENAVDKYPQLLSISQARAEHATIIYNYLIDSAVKAVEDLGNTTYKLKNSTAKLWISSINDEQPVIEIHKRETQFDLSLRKAIVSVQDKAGNNKNIINTAGEIAERALNEDGSIKNIETDSLIEPGTTATYNHRKDPVVVETGDRITYSITIYNESEQAGYANKIIDQLPGTWGTGLRLATTEGTVTSSTGNIYKIDYAATPNTITLTMEENSPKNVLAPYNEETKTLASEVILLECVVMGKADAAYAKTLTNVAYIAEEYNQYENTIVTAETMQDRDSQTWAFPQVTGTNLITTNSDIGYTGNSKNEKDLSSNETYYAGEQDDDDFEKIVILPEAFDLSLRKNITSVNGEEVSTRTPDIDLENLNNGTDTTADYNHRKDAVIVENGDIVEYNITLYNEGNIDGIATIVKDQLPTGLKLNKEFFDKQEKEYKVTSTKGNKYIVSYDEANKVVIFELDKNANTTLLKAHETGKELDEDIITLQCTVECIADDEKNTYLTNIAYIYQAEQEDGTIVTNQKAGTENGSEADRDSEPHTYPENKADELKTIGDLGYTGKENLTDLSDVNKYYEGEQDDDDFEKLVIVPKTFDLKLIKFITSVNEKETGNRVISVDTSKLNTTAEQTTAEYILEKNPVAVKAGDFVTYTIRVYNEGNYDGYATEISEDIPEGLEFIVVTEGGKIFSWDGVEQKEITEELKDTEMYNKIIEVNSNWEYNENSTIITTKALSEDLLKGFGQENAHYVDAQNKIDYKEIRVIFRVKADVTENLIIRNEAAISEDKAVDNQGNKLDIKDRDSVPGNGNDSWEKQNSDKTYDNEGKWPIYEQDDEDYDNIITKAFDLSLRKQIIKINDALYTNRYAKLLASKEDQENAKTLYNYYDVYSNKPKVKAGDVVVYSIRIYNEGEIDGYASIVADKLPSGLEFVEYEPGDGSINDRYGWTLVEGTEDLYQTDYLSYENDKNKGTSDSTIIKAYDGQGEASYQELYIECRVKEGVTKEDSLLNVAQIAEDSDENGDPIKDKDSVPGNSDGETEWKNEDDLDIEILQLQEFDLALRKFITQIENGEEIKEVTSRIPEVTYNEETKLLVYTHPKDALVVHVGDTVIYTLRIYNEGDIDGYAKSVKDDIPEYLEYLPEHNINKQNEWVMYDENGNETENVEEAVYIKTEYLAKGKGVEADEDSKKTNLIKAFDPESKVTEKNPDYKELQVAFKVKDPNSTEYEIINFAQIADDSDPNGDPIKDRDSDPDNGEEDPKEDDEDIEKVKVEYFDISLLKYVTKVLVNENGEERIIETGNIGDEKDIIPHVQINKKNIDKTVVKFVYTIQITNEGQIAGEATEITDYVPEGLIFVEEDNQFWTDEGNNIISTKQLTGTTLEPGDTAQVEVVLRWINGSDNLGPKTNIAEISEDYNEKNVPDRDSTPDNKKEGEDDIDDATVLLSVNQGGGIQSIYINLTLGFLVIILVGGILIKKFVL